MTCTLRHSQACSRYLSPSRLKHSSTIPHEPGNLPTHRVPTVTASASGLSTCRLSTESTSKLDTVTSQASCTKQVYRGFKTSDQNMYGTRSRYMDFSSATRLMGSLNVDLPKGFSFPQKLFRKRKGVPETSEAETKSDPISKNSVPAENVDQSVAQECLPEENEHNQAQSPPKLNNIRKRAESYDYSRYVERHRFIEAMHEQDSSVRIYCIANHSNNTSKTTHSVQADTSKESAPMGKPQDARSVKTSATSQMTSTVQGATNLVKSLTSYLPKLPGRQSTDGAKDGSATKPAVKKKTLIKEPVTPRSVVDRKTRGLVKSLRLATSSASQLVRMEEFCRHVTAHPAARSLAVREKVGPCLLRLRANRDIGLKEQAMEALALIGYVDPVKGRGIRILSLDGGGTRGLVTIEILRRLEEACKMDIHEIFDYICGVSTGSLIGIMLGVHKLSLDEAEHLYKTFSREIFQRHKLMGVGKLVMSYSYYDAELWEKILQKNIGLKTFQESNREANTPKVSSVSTLMNMTKLSNFLFRNYNYPPSAQSPLPGSCKYTFWQAIRASSAAPLYYQEYKLDEWIHQDGGIITNNPTAIAIHEAKLLWPTNPLQCVISIGTGRYQPTSEPEPAGTGLRDKLNKIIQSATDTEGVHTTLNDLLPPPTYFRFNPYMSEDFPLDEIRLDRWDQMRLDTQLYCRKNQMKLDKAARQLCLAKLPHQRATDWLRYQAALHRP